MSAHRAMAAYRAMAAPSGRPWLGKCVAPSELIPHVAFVELDSVASEQMAVLVLKWPAFVMLLLLGDVISHRGKRTFADGENCISVLPVKVGISGAPDFDPFRG